MKSEESQFHVWDCGFFFYSVPCIVQYGRIELRKSDSKEIQVEMEGRVRTQARVEMDIREHAGALQIRVKNERNKKLFNLVPPVVRLKVTVHVPTKVWETISVHNSNGHIEMAGIQAKELKTTQHNGQIRINQIETDLTEVKVYNGEIRVSDISGDVTGEVLNGMIQMNLHHLAQNLDLSVTNGEIKLKLQEQPQDVVYDVRTVNGLARVFGSRDWPTLVGDGTYLVKLRTTNGAIQIEQVHEYEREMLCWKSCGRENKR